MSQLVFVERPGLIVLCALTHFDILCGDGRKCRMASSVARNCVPITENRTRLVEALVTISCNSRQRGQKEPTDSPARLTKWLMDISETTQNGDLNDRLRSLHCLMEARL